MFVHTCRPRGVTSAAKQENWLAGGRLTPPGATPHGRGWCLVSHVCVGTEVLLASIAHDVVPCFTQRCHKIPVPISTLDKAIRDRIPGQCQWYMYIA